MEESKDANVCAKCSSKAKNSNTRRSTTTVTHYPSSVMQFHNGFCFQTQSRGYPPGLLPLPPLLPLQQLALTPPILHSPTYRPKTHSKKGSEKQKPFCSASSDSQGLLSSTPQAPGKFQVKACPAARENNRGISANSLDHSEKLASDLQALVPARRPDSGGVHGPIIPLLANHFLVQFDPSQKIFHYDVEITPHPSKEIARLIKGKLVQDNPYVLSGAQPAFDGRRNLYSPISFQNDKLEFFISLPIPTAKQLPLGEGSASKKQNLKLFKVYVKLVSKLDGENLTSYLNKEEDWSPLPQDYLHALDVILRESSAEKCIPVGRSLYSNSMGGAKDIGGGAIGLRGFFQSLRPTQQGLALNVDFSVTAFHESIGIIQYLQKRCDFLQDLPQKKSRFLTTEERKEVEKALKNVRVFVCHRDTDQRYRTYGLTDEATESLKFRDRDGKDLRLVDYFKEHYNHDIEYRNLPCLQISRSKPCYLPMELCVVCEGQKFLSRLSDDQTAGILKMGCQRPRERRAAINGVIRGSVGPMSGPHATEFKLQLSKEMTRLSGRVLQPPKLKLGNGGQVTDLIPTRYDRQWNLLGSHVVEGTRIERWALISFGGTPQQQSCVPKFISQLSHRCNQLGIFLSRNAVVAPEFESTKALSSISILESRLQKIYEAASSNLQLLICIMEKKHRGYADLKRIAETSIGVVSQCCLYSNLCKLGSQFLANLALKINAKVGGSTVALYNTIHHQIPRVFREDEPIIFMGADVTHPHPLDDFSPSIAAVVGSMNWPAANKYISRMRSQIHRQEIIQDLSEMVSELLEDFYQGLNKLPAAIIFFRDGVSETQFYKVLHEELQAIRAACSRFPNYKPTITFSVVQKRHHTRLFRNENENSGRRVIEENIPPGTVVDTVVTHPKEFDFYLCSHWGMKGTSRPTHYHILWDENNFTSDELQKIVHNLCYTFVRCTKAVSLVPPAYYAHLAAYRGRLYLERSDTIAIARNTHSRAGPPTKATPLPKLSDKIKKLMFYC
ncbi:protein argonaute 7-like [Aristolochia californica]|uniref:protein argonaute 7-like n=1 Tax=Aristolochia californica TaxID=171875 RepID=UPI0035DCC6D4